MLAGNTAPFCQGKCTLILYLLEKWGAYCRYQNKKYSLPVLLLISVNLQKGCSLQKYHNAAKKYKDNNIKGGYDADS